MFIHSTFYTVTLRWHFGVPQLVHVWVTNWAWLILIENRRCAVLLSLACTPSDHSAYDWLHNPQTELQRVLKMLTQCDRIIVLTAGWDAGQQAGAVKRSWETRNAHKLLLNFELKLYVQIWAILCTPLEFCREDLTDQYKPHYLHDTYTHSQRASSQLTLIICPRD